MWIGWAFLSSIGVAIVLGIITYYTSKKSEKDEKKMRKLIDARVKSNKLNVGYY